MKPKPSRSMVSHIEIAKVGQEARVEVEGEDGLNLWTENNQKIFLPTRKY